jgi:hypothetical protein
MLPITIRKRTISETDISEIQDTVHEYWTKGRKEISRVLCRRWEWLQPNGRLKDMACREILLTLKRKGLITLPPPLNNANNHKRNKTINRIDIDQTPIEQKLSGLPPVELRMVRDTDSEPLYNSLVHYHHYLGYRQIVGNHLKYIAYIGNRPVGCLGWASGS